MPRISIQNQYAGANCLATRYPDNNPSAVTKERENMCSDK